MTITTIHLFYPPPPLFTLFCGGWGLCPPYISHIVPVPFLNYYAISMLFLYLSRWRAVTSTQQGPRICGEFLNCKDICRIDHEILLYFSLFYPRNRLHKFNSNLFQRFSLWWKENESSAPSAPPKGNIRLLLSVLLTMKYIVRLFLDQIRYLNPHIYHSKLL